MMRTRKEKNPKQIPSEVISTVLKLMKQGKSTGEIAEYIFDKYDVSYDRRRIHYITQKYGK